METSERAARVALAVFDVDGVLTDGSLILGSDGSEYKNFHVRDGLGLVWLRESGCQIAVISGRSSPLVAERMAMLGIEHVYQNQPNKGKTLDALLQKLGVTAEATAYVGDDLIDLPAMRRVGFAVAVADAHPLVLEQAHWTTQQAGGRGAAREVCELIMRAQGTLEARLKRALED